MTMMNLQTKVKNLYESGATFEEIATHPLMKGSKPEQVSMYVKEKGWSKSSLPIKLDTINQLFLQRSEETKQNILTLVKDGIPVQTAFGMFGINKDNAAEWLGTDKEFGDRIQQALSLFQANIIYQMKNQDDWRAISWQLENHPAFEKQYKQDNSIKVQLSFRRVPDGEACVIEDQIIDVVECVGEAEETDKPIPLEVAKPRLMEMARKRVDDHNAKLTGTYKEPDRGDNLR